MNTDKRGCEKRGLAHSLIALPVPAFRNHPCPSVFIRGSSFVFAGVLFAFALCFLLPRHAHATSAEVKLYCKNKCQYDVREDCYEACISEQTTETIEDEPEAKTWEDLAALAEKLFEEQDYEQAVSVYEELLKLDPLSEIVHYNLGICYESMGENELAIQHYEQYLMLKPYADDRPEVEAWIRRLKSHPEQERQRYQTFTIASSPTGKVKLRIIQNSDVRLRVDIITPEPFNFKVVERVDPPSVSLRAYLDGYTPTREVIPVWRGGVKEILLHYEQDADENDRRSYLLVTVRLMDQPQSMEPLSPGETDDQPRTPRPFSGFSDGYIAYDADGSQVYTFDMADDERRFSFVFDIHLQKETTFLDEVNITQLPLKDLCEAIARFSKRSCIIDYRLHRLWKTQDRLVTYQNEKVFVENVLDYFANQFNFRWVETDEFYILLSEQGFEWLAQNSVFYNLRPEDDPDLSAYVLDPVTFEENQFWDIFDYFSNWHYISFKESVVWRLKDSAAGGEGVLSAGVLQGGPTLEDFLSAFAVANSLYWFRIWDAYFLTDRPDRIGRFVELASLGDWQEKIPTEPPARLGFDDFNLSQRSRYYFRWGHVFLNNKDGSWALREFEKSIDRAPESEDNYFYASVACLIEGKQDLAIRGFQRAVRLRPDFALAHYMLARSYEFYNDLRDAIEQYKLALADEPDFAPAARDLGFLYLRTGLLVDSIEYLSRAVDIMPADMEAQYELSRALFFHGDYEAAWNHLIVARPTEYVALNFEQIQRRLIFEFGQQWHKEWYQYQSGWYYNYPKNYYAYPGWFYAYPDWKGFAPGYYSEDARQYRNNPDTKYYPYYDNQQTGGVGSQPNMGTEPDDGAADEFLQNLNKSQPPADTIPVDPGLR